MSVNFNYTKSNSNGESECLQVGAENVQELTDILRLAGMDHSPEKMQGIVAAIGPGTNSQKNAQSSIEDILSSSVVINKDDDEESSCCPGCGDPNCNGRCGFMMERKQIMNKLINDFKRDFSLNEGPKEFRHKDKEYEDYEKILSNDPGYQEWSDKYDSEITDEDIEKMHQEYLRNQKEKLPNRR